MSSPISAAATAASPVPANPRSRVVLASLIGTTIEFYDFYVYATAAVLVFPHLFFPPGDPTAALLASFAVFGAAMVAAPRRRDLRPPRRQARAQGDARRHLLTMGIATFLIGVPDLRHGRIARAPARTCASRSDSPRLGVVGCPSWRPRTPRRATRVVQHVPQLGAPIGFIIANGPVPRHRGDAALRRPVDAVAGVPHLGCRASPFPCSRSSW